MYKLDKSHYMPDWEFYNNWQRNSMELQEALDLENRPEEARYVKHERIFIDTTIRDRKLAAKYVKPLMVEFLKVLYKYYLHDKGSQEDLRKGCKIPYNTLHQKLTAEGTLQIGRDTIKRYMEALVKGGVLIVVNENFRRKDEPRIFKLRHPL